MTLLHPSSFISKRKEKKRRRKAKGGKGENGVALHSLHIFLLLLKPSLRRGRERIGKRGNGCTGGERERGRKERGGSTLCHTAFSREGDRGGGLRGEWRGRKKKSFLSPERKKGGGTGGNEKERWASPQFSHFPE